MYGFGANNTAGSPLQGGAGNNAHGHLHSGQILPMVPAGVLLESIFGEFPADAGGDSMLPDPVLSDSSAEDDMTMGPDPDSIEHALPTSNAMQSEQPPSPRSNGGHFQSRYHMRSSGGTTNRNASQNTLSAASHQAQLHQMQQMQQHQHHQHQYSGHQTHMMGTGAVGGYAPPPFLPQQFLHTSGAQMGGLVGNSIPPIHLVMDAAGQYHPSQISYSPSGLPPSPSLMNSAQANYELPSPTARSKRPPTEDAAQFYASALNRPVASPTSSPNGPKSPQPPSNNMNQDATSASPAAGSSTSPKPTPSNRRRPSSSSPGVGRASIDSTGSSGSNSAGGTSSPSPSGEGYFYRSRDKTNYQQAHKGVLPNPPSSAESSKRIRCTWSYDETRQLLLVLKDASVEHFPDLNSVRNELLRADPNSSKTLEHVRNKKANLIQKAHTRNCSIADVLRTDLQKLEAEMPGGAARSAAAAAASSASYQQSQRESHAREAKSGTNGHNGNGNGNSNQANQHHAADASEHPSGTSNNGASHSSKQETTNGRGSTSASAAGADSLASASDTHFGPSATSSASSGSPGPTASISAASPRYVKGTRAPRRRGSRRNASNSYQSGAPLAMTSTAQQLAKVAAASKTLTVPSSANVSIAASVYSPSSPSSTGSSSTAMTPGGSSVLAEENSHSSSGATHGDSSSSSHSSRNTPDPNMHQLARHMRADDSKSGSRSGEEDEKSSSSSSSFPRVTLMPGLPPPSYVSPLHPSGVSIGGIVTPIRPVGQVLLSPPTSGSESDRLRPTAHLRQAELSSTQPQQLSFRDEERSSAWIEQQFLKLWRSVSEVRQRLQLPQVEFTPLSSFNTLSDAFKYAEEKVADTCSAPETASSADSSSVQHWPSPSDSPGVQTELPKENSNSMDTSEDKTASFAPVTDVKEEVEEEKKIVEEKQAADAVDVSSNAVEEMKEVKNEDSSMDIDRQKPEEDADKEKKEEEKGEEEGAAL